MEDLKVTKDKLKKVANAWAEIKSLSPNAIYDINDTTINWNKKITFEEAKDIVTQKVQIETPKPTAKDETKPKEPKKVSVIGIVLIIMASIMALCFTTWLFTDDAFEMNENQINFVIFFIEIIIGITFLTLGIVLLFIYNNNKKYKTAKNEKLPNKTTCILGIISTIIGIVFLLGGGIATLSNANSWQCIMSVLSFILLMFSICLIIYKGTIYKYDLFEYKNNLQIYEENIIKYNKEQLPKDIEEYENSVQNLYNEQIKLINTTHKKIGEKFAKIEEIDIISVSQAKYAQQLLDYIYKGAESIKEAFEKLENEKEKVNKQIEEDNQKLENNTKNITNKTYKNNADNEKKDKNFKSKWKRLSKLAKSAILVPVIYFVPAIIVTILANVIKTPSMIATLITIQLITLYFAGGIFIFEAVAIVILLYRSIKKSLKK